MRNVLLGMAWALAALLVASAAWAETTAPLERASVLAPVGQPCCPAVAYAIRQPLRTAKAKPWRVTLAGYAWMSNIDGESYEEGVESDVEIKFSDIFDKLEYSFQGVVEFQYKRFFVAIDTTFKLLKVPGPALGPVPTNVKLDKKLLDLRLGYTVLRREIGRDQWGACCYPRYYELDAAVGARYWSNETTVEPAVPVPAPSLSDTESWWDPYVGMRARWPFAKRWFFQLYGDVGGFGLGDASELTWQVQAVLGFRVTRWLWLGVGYRALDVDRVEGEGLEKAGESLLYHGPGVVVALAF